ncbi:spermatogenesis associated 6-like protein isoform X6 [Anabrus simplex]|uniref:spermatogenesis associated 6-like protein isoform X6 n=1 Tax=Anabrus simplex TaxID=316456 RepID=UPI0035A3BA1C
MSRKDLSVTVELDVHTVKCQGVWLCPKGDVTLRICTLECTARTSKKPPVFPIPYNEKFVFQKTFSGVFCLVDLQHQLAKEIFCAELTQWPENTLGIVLAKFETTLEELLFPKSVQKENVPGVDAELLMEPEHTFPGIISPKIHVSAKITVGESVNEHLQKINSSLFHSRHMWHGKYAPLSSLQNHAFRRQKRVCHSKDSAAHLYKHAWKMVDGKIPISKSFQMQCVIISTLWAMLLKILFPKEEASKVIRISKTVCFTNHIWDIHRIYQRNTFLLLIISHNTWIVIKKAMMKNHIVEPFTKHWRNFIVRYMKEQN